MLVIFNSLFLFFWINIKSASETTANYKKKYLNTYISKLNYYINKKEVEIMYKEKRGQAAMEFLMTYGWAILAAVIVIAVLAAFGVFSPGKYVPNRCILSAPLGCNAGTADTTGISLEIRNGAGEQVSVTAIDVTGCTEGSITPAIPDTLTDQELQVYTIPCTGGLTTGKFQGDITITYTKTGSSLDLTSSGEIVDSI